MPENNPVSDLLNGIFWHKCIEPGCRNLIMFDDEPTCFAHSPDSGSYKAGYSAFDEFSKANRENR